MPETVSSFDVNDFRIVVLPTLGYKVVSKPALQIQHVVRKDLHAETIVCGHPLCEHRLHMCISGSEPLLPKPVFGQPFARVSHDSGAIGQRA